MSKLSPSILCQESIRLLTHMVCSPMGFGLSKFSTYGEVTHETKQVASDLPLSDRERSQSLEWVSQRLLLPMVESLVRLIPNRAQLVERAMPLHYGYAGDKEEFMGVGLRLILSKPDKSFPPGSQCVIMRLDVRYNEPAV